MMYQLLGLNPYKLLKFFLLIYFLFWGKTNYTQNIDSLKKELTNHPLDTTLVKIYGEIGDHFYYSGKNDSAIYYWETAKRAALLAEKKELPELHHFILKKKLAVVYNDLAYLYIYKGRYTKAINYFNQCILLKQQTNDQEGEIQTYTNLGYLYTHKNQIDSAIFYNLNAYKLAKKNKLERQAAVSSMQIGVLHTKNGAINQALKRFNESIAYFKQINDSIALSTSYNNLAKAYESIEKNEDALTYFFKSLDLKLSNNDQKGAAIVYNNIGACYQKINELELALKYYQKALKIFHGIGHKMGISTTMNNIGKMHFDLYQLDSATHYYQQSLRIRKEINDIEGIAISLINLSRIYYEQEAYHTAIKSLNEAYKITTQIQNPSLIADCSLQLYQNYEKLKDYKNALFYFKKHDEYNALIFSEKNLKRVNNQLKGEAVKKQQYQDSLKVQLQIKNNKEVWEDELKKQHVIISKKTAFAIGIILLIIIGALVFFSFYKK
ncbi:MAG: tetratricopeptide repeat protein [Flavobacteriales bacterium]|nr:tetratricopeptide repeat protein [Flavobacteriales bacterium]